MERGGHGRAVMCVCQPREAHSVSSHTPYYQIGFLGKAPEMRRGFVKEAHWLVGVGGAAIDDGKGLRSSSS